MRTSLRSTALLVILLATVMVSRAQDEEQHTPRTPRWISEKGYWVVESNIKTPYHSVVHFYNNENIQVYQETVDGVRINLEKTRTKMRLKKILEQSIIAWEKSHLQRHDEQWVSNSLR